MPSPTPDRSSSSTPIGGAGSSTHKHALTPVEKQRSQLERLLKDPAKPAYIPAPPKEKTIRPAREMMKNVQGSSAGAGSGEFHVYKAARRREYERLRMLEEESQRETLTAEFERKRKEAEEITNSKTAKNRAKRQKKKERAKAKGGHNKEGSASADEGRTAADDKPGVPLKKRRLINGKELVFKRPGEESDEEEGGDGPEVGPQEPQRDSPPPAAVPVVEAPRITIHEDD